jgi:hypothetical protein
MNPLTETHNGAMLNSLMITSGGFDSSYGKGAEAMRRKVRGFFYALTVMVGGVLGSREARRTLCPVCQPGTSLTALRLTDQIGGYKTIAKETVMSKSKITPIRPGNHAGTSEKQPLKHPDNPFIGINDADTMSLVRSGIACIQAFDRSESMGDGEHGLFLFLQVLSDALGYHVEHKNV